MKMFSMILVALFFLSFTSIASAEPVYTITNKSEGMVVAILPDNRVDPWRAFGLRYNECLRIKTSDFDHLRIFGVYSGARVFESLCIPCKPNNYKITHDKFLWYLDDYELEVGISSNKGSCSDFEQWITQKEPDYTISND